MRENLKFVVVGHVDHGKSTLIGRLLYDTNSLPPDKMEEVRLASEQSADGTPEFAFIMDHLEEERNNRITIDTAQIFFKTSRRDYVIIDAPGHKQFLKNMITGSSQAQAALLLIDAEEGLQEQTNRHAYMLSLLGLKQVVVVINKMDLVDYAQDRFDALSQQITERLAELKTKPLCIVPISARLGDNVATKGANMNWYQGPTLLESLDQLQAQLPQDQSAVRMPVQDIYEIEGEKVLVGKVASGVVKSGQEIVFHPCGKSAVVDHIKVLDGQLEQAQAGLSIGLVLRDGNGAFKALKRGEVACDRQSSPMISNTIVATVFWMNGEPLNMGDRIELKCATQEAMCTVKKISKRMDSATLKILEEQAETLRDTDVAQLTLKVESYLCLDSFEKVPELGRFVLTRDSDTVAGGVVH